MDESSPWTDPAIRRQTRVILDSFRRFLGRELLERPGDEEGDARRLFEAPFVVVSHNTAADPILNYANRTALNLWEAELPALLKMPSRLTAEPMEREERARMLERTQVHGYIDDYAGIRISTTGRRFRIENAIVWNLVDETGRPAGQAATFCDFTYLQ